MVPHLPSLKAEYTNFQADLQEAWTEVAQDGHTCGRLREETATVLSQTISPPCWRSRVPRSCFMRELEMRLRL
jgi:hypothetical protein